MKHFLQYHNSKKIGYSVSKLSEPKIFTDKSVKHLSSNIVWIISGEGASPKRFYLAAVFKVNHISADAFDTPPFKNSAYGIGTIFGETIPIEGMDWFEVLKVKLNHFRNGLTEIKDPEVISIFRQLAGPKAL